MAWIFFPCSIRNNWAAENSGRITPFRSRHPRVLQKTVFRKIFLLIGGMGSPGYGSDDCYCFLMIKIMKYEYL
jgi:hypothetical protein